jgi:membrane protein DedA with SNARE-associated domain
VISIQHFLLGHGGTVVYLVVFGLVFAEDALLVGFVLPGETAAILGGVAASQGAVSVIGMIAVVVLAAILGDSVGYFVGHHLGPRAVQTRPLRSHQHRLERVQTFIRERGAFAVFLGRFVLFFRATIPALAGMSHMPYRRFVLWNVPAGIIWGIYVVLLGWFAGRSFAKVEQTVGLIAAIVVAVIVVALIVVWAIRRHRRDSEHELVAEPPSALGRSETPQ